MWQLREILRNQMESILVARGGGSTVASLTGNKHACRRARHARRRDALREASLRLRRGRGADRPGRDRVPPDLLHVQQLPNPKFGLTLS